ncbi:MAG TPA: hypothetical protein VEZ46_05655 [Mycobacteriales bacterium]|jgi:hypothetical protein|nr:hypothetical protein [Mycobacteriales bacterium]
MTLAGRTWRDPSQRARRGGGGFSFTGRLGENLGNPADAIRCAVPLKTPTDEHQ